MKDKLDHLLQQARKATHGLEASSDDSLPPGLATRIAARWSASDDRALHAALFERITACCLVPALAIWAILTWSTPAPAEPNVMELLLTAQLVVENQPPFDPLHLLMHPFRILRIVLMITAIFAAGIGVGYRFLPPPAGPTPVVKVTSADGREVSADSIVAFYDQELQLDDSQKAALRELAQPFLNELTRTQPQSKERIAVFRAYFPRVRALLRADQHAAFDDLTKHFRERMRQTGK